MAGTRISLFFHSLLQINLYIFCRPLSSPSSLPPLTVTSPNLSTSLTASAWSNMPNHSRPALSADLRPKSCLWSTLNLERLLKLRATSTVTASLLWKLFLHQCSTMDLLLTDKYTSTLSPLVALGWAVLCFICRLPQVALCWACK
jgi:hypothetical protein